MTREFLTRAEAAEYLSARGLIISYGYLKNLAVSGGGPTYHRFGKRALYRPEELNSWAADRLSVPRASTSSI